MPGSELGLRTPGAFRHHIITSDIVTRPLPIPYKDGDVRAIIRAYIIFSGLHALHDFMVNPSLRVLHGKFPSWDGCESEMHCITSNGFYTILAFECTQPVFLTGIMWSTIALCHPYRRF